MSICKLLHKDSLITVAKTCEKEFALNMNSTKTIHHNVYVLIMTMLHGEIITCYVLPDYFMYRPCPVTKTVTQSLVDNIT